MREVTNVASEFEAVGRGHAHVQKDRVEFLSVRRSTASALLVSGVSFEAGRS